MRGLIVGLSDKFNVLSVCFQNGMVYRRDPKVGKNLKVE